MRTATVFLSVLLASCAPEKAQKIAALPQSDQVLTKIAFGSCADEELPQPIWQTIAADNPDVFLFMGDNVYADRNRGESVQKFTRAELEFAYSTLDAHADFVPFRASVPMLSTWDDHDLGKNDAGVEFELKQDAKDLMIETLGIPQDAAMLSRPGVYHAATYGPVGQRLQVIMLDTRWFRSALKETDKHGAVGKERYVPDADPSKTMLGAEQWVWLKRQFEQPADLRILVSSIQVIADGHGWEAWRTMPLEREKLYAMIEETGAGNIIILSGDRHVGGLYRKTISPEITLVEVTSSSLNLPWSNWNPDKDRVAETGPNQIGDLYGKANFGTLDIDWDKRQVLGTLKSEAGIAARSINVAF